MKDERIGKGKVLNEILIMVQNAHRQIDNQMLQILHMTGYCGEFIANCPKCVEDMENETKVTLDDFTNEEE